MPQTPEQIADFLNRLDTDDDFRDKLKNDTASVMEEYGIPYDPEQTPPPEEVRLPAKGDVAENYEAYKDLLFPDNEHRPNTHEYDIRKTAS